MQFLRIIKISFHSTLRMKISYKTKQYSKAMNLLNREISSVIRDEKDLDEQNILNIKISVKNVHEL